MSIQRVSAIFVSISKNCFWETFLIIKNKKKNFTELDPVNKVVKEQLGFCIY